MLTLRQIKQLASPICLLRRSFRMTLFTAVNLEIKSYTTHISHLFPYRKFLGAFIIFSIYGD
ncbi:hypothetical protein D3C71_1617670 [compost metagenome]